jgi:hypothetical protein
MHHLTFMLHMARARLKKPFSLSATPTQGTMSKIWGCIYVCVSMYIANVLWLVELIGFFEGN